MKKLLSACLLAAASLEASSISGSATSTANCQYQVTRHFAPGVNTGHTFTFTHTQTVSNSSTTSTCGPMPDPNPIFGPVETATAAGGHATASANESHDYGQLRGRATATDSASPFSSNGKVNSAYDDGLFIPFQAGTSGFVRFTLWVTGEQYSPMGGGGSASNLNRLLINGSTVRTLAIPTSIDPGFSTLTATYDVPYSNFANFTFGADLAMIANGNDFSRNQINQYVWIQAFRDGSPVTFVTQSGEDYATPEPGAVTLAVIGLALIAVGRKRLRSGE